MIDFGFHLVAALFAGLLGWFVLWLCSRLSAPGWLCTILSYAVLVYFFWLFSGGVHITIGR